MNTYFLTLYLLMSWESVYDKALENRKCKNRKSEKRLDAKFLFAFKPLHPKFQPPNSNEAEMPVISRQVHCATQESLRLDINRS